MRTERVIQTTNKIEYEEFKFKLSDEVYNWIIKKRNNWILKHKINENKKYVLQYSNSEKYQRQANNKTSKDYKYQKSIAWKANEVKENR